MDSKQKAAIDPAKLEEIGLVYARQWRPDGGATVRSMVARLESVRDGLAFVYAGLVTAGEIDKLEDLALPLQREIAAKAEEWIPLRVNRNLTEAEARELQKRRRKAAQAVVVITYLLQKHNL